jgi:hypothetical protein
MLLHKKVKTPQTHASFNPEGLNRLREALRDISFRLYGLSFKVDVRGDVVWIRMLAANQGTQETVSTAKAKLDILADAVRMPRDAFRESRAIFEKERIRAMIYALGGIH